MLNSVGERIQPWRTPMLTLNHIVLAYLMLFAALSNAVCLYNASFLPMISAIAFYFHVLSWFIDT